MDTHGTDLSGARVVTLMADVELAAPQAARCFSEHSAVPRYYPWAMSGLVALQSHAKSIYRPALVVAVMSVACTGPAHEPGPVDDVRQPVGSPAFAGGPSPVLDCNDCDDGNPCTEDQCVDDACVHIPNPCDDNLACTVDSCDPDTGACVHDPTPDLCGSYAQCAEVVCSAEAPSVDPSMGVQQLAVTGCWAVLDHGWCADDFDGCACNGREMCQPTGGAEDSGCFPAPRPSWPCEQSANGDGDACTEENCCEPWDPEGCRLHRLAEAATEGDDTPRLQSFCDGVLDSGASTVVSTPDGDVTCAGGGDTYKVPISDPLFDLLTDTDKPDGYWCEDCQPCTSNQCDSETGGCTFDPLLDGSQVGEPADLFESIFFDMICDDARKSCDEDSINHGCGQEQCWDGLCRSGQNPDNADPSHSDECVGVPTLDILGLPSCFDLSCENVSLVEGRPHFDCVPGPADELCEDGLFCNGPAECSITEVCGAGCTVSDAVDFLVDLPRTDVVPTPGSHLFGCVQLDGKQQCSDDIGCTDDSCDEVTDTCVQVPDDRRCADNPEDWDPCHPAACIESDEIFVCENAFNPCGNDEDGCQRSCLEVNGTRQCIAEEGKCEQPCFEEGYYELNLQPLVDLCPFMPTMPPGMDREYAGNGPEVDISVDLSVSAVDAHDVVATVRIEARETDGGDTVLQHEFAPIVVGTALVEIDYISSSTRGRARGHSNDGQTAGVACGGCGVVNFYDLDGVISSAVARGDTANDDVSHDADCDDDVFIEKLELSSIEVFGRRECPEPPI